MTFAELDKAIAPAPGGAAAHPLRDINPLLLATGLFVFATGISGNLLGSAVHAYAGRWVERTLVCETYMIWLAVGCWMAIGKATWLRVAIVIATVAVYAFAATHDEQVSMAPQAMWLLCVRLFPPGFAGIFGNENLMRVRLITLAGLACLAGQVAIFALFSSALAAIGVGAVDGNVISAPQWFSGVVWGAYYVELAVLLPYVERHAGQFD